MSVEIPKMVAMWSEGWASLDAERIANLYAVNGKHMSSVVTERMGIENGTLTSRAAIQLYAEQSAKRLASFRAEIINVISEDTPKGGKACVEYWRILNGDENRRQRVAEILEWENDEITSCRVFHF
jgi:hypothetical protein